MKRLLCLLGLHSWKRTIAFYNGQIDGFGRECRCCRASRVMVVDSATKCHYARAAQ